MKVSTMTNLCYSSRGTGVKTSAIEASRRLLGAGFVNQDLFLCGLIRPTHNCSFSGDNWKDEALALKALAQQLGINFHQCHLPYYPGKYYDHHNDEFNRFFWSMFDRGIEICELLGIKCAVVHPFRAADTDREDIAAHVAENRRLYGPHAEKAARTGIRFAFENLKPASTFGACAEDLIAITEEFRTEDSGICWDVGHGQLTYGDEQTDAIMQLGSRIIALHVHDNHGEKDDHYPPFIGSIQWEALMGALRKAGYQGYLNFEIATNRNLPDLLRDDMARYCAKAGDALVKLFEEAHT